MPTIKVNVPPDHTPEEEEELVAAVAASFEDSTGSDDVNVEVNRTEEVDYKTTAAKHSSRWS